MSQQRSQRRNAMTVGPIPAPILGFHGEHRFLSNFEPARVHDHEDFEWYPTVEHAYHALKTLDREQRRMIRLAKTPGIAKKLGQKLVQRADWKDIKEAVMLDLNTQKYRLPKYRDLLLATGEAYIEETNTWKDTYWGVCNGVGDNRLGKILMAIRTQLRMEKNAAALAKFRQDVREAEWAMGKATGSDGGAYRP